MSTTFTATASRTSTFTEARVRYVMNKVLADLVTLAAREFITLERVTEWTDDVQAVLMFEAVERFQVKLSRPDGRVSAISYRVFADGSVSEDAESGGINFYALPAGTSVSIVIGLLPSGPARERALAYLRKRGWGTAGTLLNDVGRDRAFSSGGYALSRNLIGWS